MNEILGNLGLISISDASKGLTPSEQRLRGLASDGVPNRYLVPLRTAVDLRRTLLACEVLPDIPFTPERFFLVHDVP